jgi:ssDNA-binding replication factor A large subunit
VIRVKKEKIMGERSDRERAEKAFRDWRDGTGSITDLLADDLRWTILGRSQVSKTYDSKEEFIGEVLQPFGAARRDEFLEYVRKLRIRDVAID